MKLKRTAALVLTALLAAGTVCLTACGSGNGTAETQQAIVGDWVRTETIDDEGEEIPAYAEAKLEKGLSKAQIRQIETIIKGIEGVENCAILLAEDSLMEDENDYITFEFTDYENGQQIIDAVEKLDGVASVYTDLSLTEEVWVQVYLKDDVTEAEIRAIRAELEKTKAVSEWSFSSAEEQIQEYRELEWTDAEIRAMISRGEIVSYFDMVIPNPKDARDVVANLNTMDGVEEVYNSASYFHFKEDGSVIVIDQFEYVPTEDDDYSYMEGMLTGTYTVEGDTVRTKLEYNGHDLSETLKLQDGKLVQETNYLEDELYGISFDYTEIYEKL